MIQGREIEQGGFFLFLGAVSLGLVLVVWPFVAPLLWAVLAAIMFQPLYRWFQARFPGRDSESALLTLLVIFIAVIIPALWIGSAVVSEAAGLVAAFQQGQIDVAQWFEQVLGILPASVRAGLNESGWGDFEALVARAQDFLQASLGFIAQQAISIGGSIFGFLLAFAVGLYVSFFLIRDG